MVHADCAVCTGDRLLGFAAEKVDEFAVCVDSLRRVMKTRPDDTYAERVLRNCETKLNLKRKFLVHSQLGLNAISSRLVCSY